MAFTVRWGVITSSIRYNNRREGNARENKIIAGIMVHTVSTFCSSTIDVHGCEFIVRAISA
jgi:hypothetical protein